MNRNLAIVLIVVSFIVGTLLSSGTATAEKGGPFAPIWEAIFGLQTQVDNIEKRVEALENPPIPKPPIVSDVIIPSGTSTPGCEGINECYIPYEAGVLVGDELTWTNTDSAAHTVTAGNADDGLSGQFNSGLLLSGDTFSHTFNSVEEIPYFCMVHPWMQGIVAVLDES